MSLNKLAEEIHDNAKAKGFWDQDYRSTSEMLMLIVTEVAEASEEARLDNYDLTGDPEGLQALNRHEENGKPVGFAIELADIIIRTLDACAGLGIDIQTAVEIKMAYNKTREYKHNKTF